MIFVINELVKCHERIRLIISEPSIRVGSVSEPTDSTISFKNLFLFDKSAESHQSFCRLVTKKKKADHKKKNQIIKKSYDNFKINACFWIFYLSKKPVSSGMMS